MVFVITIAYLIRSALAFLLEVRWQRAAVELHEDLDMHPPSDACFDPDLM